MAANPCKTAESFHASGFKGEKQWKQDIIYLGYKLEKKTGYLFFLWLPFCLSESLNVVQIKVLKVEKYGIATVAFGITVELLS